MRYLLFFIILLHLAVYANIPQDMYVMPVQKNVKIYGNSVRKLHEDALFKATLNSRLKVLDIKGEAYKIRDKFGRIGWVEKRFVVPIKKDLLDGFDDAIVHNYDDTPYSSYIGDAPEVTEMMIKLKRSFKDNLKEHTDRETVERIVKY